MTIRFALLAALAHATAGCCNAPNPPGPTESSPSSRPSVSAPMGSQAPCRRADRWKKPYTAACEACVERSMALEGKSPCGGKMLRVAKCLDDLTEAKNDRMDDCTDACTANDCACELACFVKHAPRCAAFQEAVVDCLVSSCDPVCL